MYEIDPRFFNEDSSINVEVAMAAGHKARSQAAGEGYQAFREAAAKLFRSVRHGTLDLRARVASSAALQNKAT